MNYLGIVDEKEAPSGYIKYFWVNERCVNGIDWCIKNNVDYTVLQNKWEDEANIQSAIDYLAKVKKVVLSYIGELLNDYHHVNYCVSQWNILLSAWIDMFLGSYYDKYLNIREIESSNNNFECIVYNINAPISMLDYLDYMELVFNQDEYHRYQYSMLLDSVQQLNHITKMEKGDYQRPEIIFGKKEKGNNKAVIYRSLISTFKKITHIQDKVVLQSTYLPTKFLTMIMLEEKGKVTNYNYDYNVYERSKIPQRLDYSWRSKEESISKSFDEFTQIICRLIKRDLPIVYVEGYRYLLERAKRLYKYALHPNTVFFSASGIGPDEIFKTYLALIRKSNTTLCGIQHGGNYGIEKNQVIDNEITMCDTFYTWGWRYRNNNLTRPMPSAKLMNSRLLDVKKGQNILYVNYCFSKNIARLTRIELFHDYWRQKELSFFKQLSSPVKEKLLVRMYQNDYGWGTKKEIETSIPDLRFDTISDYYESLNNVNLVVLPYWQTTILEALYANKPILVLTDQRMIIEQAIDDINAMEQVGILVTSWETLLMQLETIHNNVDEWWNDPSRQAVVQKIKKKYTYMPMNAKEIWEQEIKSFISNK